VCCVSSRETDRHRNKNSRKTDDRPTEDGTWVVVDVDAIAGLKVAVVAWLSALVISLVFIFILVFIDDCGFWVV
jgi:hypothetical protein